MVSGIENGLRLQIEARLQEINDLLSAGVDPAELIGQAHEITASGVPLVAHGQVAALPAPEPAPAAPALPEGFPVAVGGAGEIAVPVTHQEVPAVEALPEPAWSQNTADNVSPGEPALARDHATDCGWQVACMIVYSTRGVEIPEAVAEGYGKGRDATDGLSTAEEIAAYLSSEHCHLNASVDRQPYQHQMATLMTQLAQQHPVAVRGAWYGPGTSHWVLAEGYTPDTLAYRDPWPTDPAARSKTIAWRDLEAITAPAGGDMVLVKEEARYK